MSIWTKEKHAKQVDNRTGTSNMAKLLKESIKERHRTMAQHEIDKNTLKEIDNLTKEVHIPKKSGENILYHDIPTLHEQATKQMLLSSKDSFINKKVYNKYIIHTYNVNQINNMLIK